MSSDRTQTFFHQYANHFDAIYGNQNGVLDSIVNRLFRKSMRLRYEKSIAGCEPVQGKSVLDVGCGPGHYAITVAQRGASRVVGIDFADGMLQLATEHARKVGVAERCKFMVADFYTYEPKEIFDYVIV
ncbi:MAG: methyltransferase domain-containing protein, partial [Candidatus Korobacteraceae bacterium]